MMKDSHDLSQRLQGSRDAHAGSERLDRTWYAATPARADPATVATPQKAWIDIL
jgi:hypothetical protein